MFFSSSFFSFTLIYFILFLFLFSFKGKEPNQIHKEITRYAKHYPKVAFPKHFSPAASSLLLGLLHPKPSMRLGNLRGGARGIKMNDYFLEINWKKLEQKGYVPSFLPEVKDAYDVKNFKAEDKNFAKSIDDDDENVSHEEWAQEF